MQGYFENKKCCFISGKVHQNDQNIQTFKTFGLILYALFRKLLQLFGVLKGVGTQQRLNPLHQKILRETGKFSKMLLLSKFCHFKLRKINNY